MSRIKGKTHSRLKENRINTLCRKYNCTHAELKRDHSDELSYPLWAYLNKMIRQDQYVHGLEIKFAKMLNPDVIQVKCYFCNKKILCIKSFYEKRKTRVFCNNRCRDNCKHARARFIDDTLCNRRLIELFKKEEDTVIKHLHVSIDKRIKSRLESGA